MDSVTSIPSYMLRGFEILGFRNLAHCVDHLFANGLKTGILIAMNAEKLINAEQDTVLNALINNAEYKYADGISVVRAIRRKYPTASVSRIAGVDLWEALMQRAGQSGVPVFLIGARADILQQTEAILRSQWNVNIAGSQHGYFTPDQRNSLFERVSASGAAIVTVAMGSPKQEILMRDCYIHYQQALYVGVGGTYDVFTGHVKRAPQAWRNRGLEWLYRLLSQPGRICRQIKLLKFLGYYYSGRL